MAEHEALFLAMGLSPKEVKTLLKNADKCATIAATAAEAGITIAGGGCAKTKGNLVMMLATKIKPTHVARRAFVAAYVGDARFVQNAQVEAALTFVHARPLEVDVAAASERAAFEEACGVGVVVGAAEIQAVIDALIAEHKGALAEERYRFPIARTFLYALNQGNLRWADGRTKKQALDASILALLGPKTEADKAKKKKKKKKAKKPPKSANKNAAGGAASAPATPPPPAVDFTSRPLAGAINSEAHKAAHAKVTGGRVRTRFPPEPNGYLHIGHAKSMCFNFEGAFRVLGAPGDTIFRYDDTNPEAESQEFIDNIADNVAWLGWTPVKTTYSSDYFDQLHAFAVQLIRAGKAYVCHQTREAMEASREVTRAMHNPAVDPSAYAGKVPESPWRDRSVADNLRLFDDMRKGKFAAGAAMLRLKMDMRSNKSVLWDPVAYRIKYVAHPHAGDKWCIYPTYDYTHCIVDSLEHIDYSICTLEFEARRDSYYWLVEALDLWRAQQWEFSRLNITHTVLSKRKLRRLVEARVVRGWDDPRLLTINGLRRRGYTAAGINAFCRDVGVTRNANLIQMARLEHFARNDLDRTSRRGFCVLAPLRVDVTNFGDNPDAVDGTEWVLAPNFPQDKQRGVHRVALSAVVYLDRSSFRLEDEKSYYGLAPGKTVRLKYAKGVLTCTGVRRGDDGAVLSLEATYDRLCKDDPRSGKKNALTAAGNKPKKGAVHWVSSVAGAKPARAEVRLYSPLFTAEVVGDATGDWMDDVATDGSSETIISDAMIDMSLAKAEAGGEPGGPRFQFERVGYFCVDPDSTARRLVFNRTLELKSNYKPGKK